MCVCVCVGILLSLRLTDSLIIFSVYIWHKQDKFSLDSSGWMHRQNAT